MTSRSIRPASIGLVLALGALFVALPLLEVYLLIQVGQALGVLPTLGILVAEAALGAWLMRREGSRAWQALSGAFGKGTMPSRELADAGLVLIGGLMFMLPGFATDVIGLICLLPFTRFIPRRVIAWLVARQALRRGVTISPLRGQGTVIEGEVVEQSSSGRTGSEQTQVSDQTPVIEGRIID